MTEQAEKTVRNVTGRVISNRMDKTITVLVERRVPHPLYRKYVRRSTKLHAHDENNECREGDTVMIVQSRPISKTKAWRLVKIVERGEEV
jgi:small subunit ribosomal protein S17